MSPWWIVAPVTLGVAAALLARGAARVAALTDELRRRSSRTASLRPELARVAADAAELRARLRQRPCQ